MKKVFVLLIAAASFASCKKEPKPLTKEQINKTIDSVTRLRIRESDAQAKRDLDRRMRIELKVRVDSIIAARARHSNPDSARKAQTPPVVPQQTAGKVNIVGGI